MTLPAGSQGARGNGSGSGSGNANGGGTQGQGGTSQGNGTGDNNGSATSGDVVGHDHPAVRHLRDGQRPRALDDLQLRSRRRPDRRVRGRRPRRCHLRLEWRLAQASDVEYVETDATGTVTAVNTASLTLTDSDTGQTQTIVADPAEDMFDGVSVSDVVVVTYHQSAGQLIADVVDDETAGN